MNERNTYTFPPDDLLRDLIDLYFAQYNIYAPVLHRPTFEQAIQDGLHLRDSGFGAVVLMVCALASRCSDDPRVLLDAEEINAKVRGQPASQKTYHSAGWVWFMQVQRSKLAMSFLPPCLYDLQVCYVSDLFALLLCSTFLRSLGRTVCCYLWVGNSYSFYGVE